MTYRTTWKCECGRAFPSPSWQGNAPRGWAVHRRHCKDALKDGAPTVGVGAPGVDDGVQPADPTTTGWNTPPSAVATTPASVAHNDWVWGPDPPD